MHRAPTEKSRLPSRSDKSSGATGIYCDCAPAAPAASPADAASDAFLASSFAEILRMFCPARSIPPASARLYSESACSRLSAGCVSERVCRRRVDDQAGKGREILSHGKVRPLPFHAAQL